MLYILYYIVILSIITSMFISFLVYQVFHFICLLKLDMDNELFWDFMDWLVNILDKPFHKPFYKHKNKKQ